MGRLSLQLKVLLLLALGTGSLLAVLSLMAVTALRENTKRSLQEHLSVAQLAASQLDLLLDYSLKTLDAHGQDLDAVGALSNPAVQGLLQRVRWEMPIYPRYVALLDAQGRVVDTNPLLPELAGQDRSHVEEVAQALKDGESSLSGLYPDIAGEKAFYLVAPVYGRERRVTGALMAAVVPRQSNLVEFLPRVPLGPSGYVEVVGWEGIILASSRPERIYQPSDHGERLATLIRSGGSTVGTCHRCHTPLGEGREQEVLAFAALSRFPWGIAIRRDEGEVFAPVRRLERRLVLLGVAGLGVALTATWVGSRRVVASLERLVSASARLARGDLETPMPTTGEREVRLLGEALEGMRQGLQQSIAETGRRERKLTELSRRRETELAALVKTSASLVAGRDETETLEMVLRTVVDTFPSVDAGVLFLYEPDGALAMRAAVGYDEEPLSRVRLRPGEGLAGQVFQEGKPIVCHTLEEVNRALETATPENRALLLAARQGRDPKSIVGVPLRYGEAILGTLVLVSLSQPSAFPPEDVVVITALASQVASILEKARLLEEAAEARALREADRLKSDFLSNISHELQTPLASLRASLDFLSLSSAGEAGEIQGGLLENARHNAERLQKLVSDLIDVARLQNLQLKLDLEPLDLREVVQPAGESFGPLLAGKSQTLEIAVPETPVLVLGDERRLEQVLNNLVMNAHQYTPPVGHITITLGEEDSQVVVSVADTGPGISREERERLFQRFYRIPSGPAHASLGLGLAIAKGLVELHGGRIWVESEPGRGSIFRFSLPRTEGHESPHR